MLSTPEHFQGKENVRLHVPQEDTTQNQKSFMSVDLIGRSLVFIQSEPMRVQNTYLFISSEYGLPVSGERQIEQKTEAFD